MSDENDFAAHFAATLKVLDSPARLQGHHDPIVIVYTDEPWEPEVGEAVVRALRATWWDWRGVVVNLRPGEDIQTLDEERAQALYAALHARFGPAAASEADPADV